MNLPSESPAAADVKTVHVFVYGGLVQHVEAPAGVVVVVHDADNEPEPGEDCWLDVWHGEGTA